MTILSIGLNSMGAVWDWYFRFMQPFPMLYDENGSLFFQFEGYTILLDEFMKIRLMEVIYNDDLFRAELADISNRVLIDHDPMPNTERTSGDYHLSCILRSGTPLDPESLYVAWNTDGGPVFESAPLQHVMAAIYSADIPAQPVGTTVYYSIHAESTGGSVANNPWTAPETLHQFQVIEDSAPPELTHDPISMWPVDRWPPVIDVMVSDALPVTVSLELEINGGATLSVLMGQDDNGTWSAECPGTVVAGDTVTYRIVATDDAILQNTAVDPSTGSHEMVIKDAMPAAVIDLDPNQSSGPFIRDTLDELGIETDYFQTVPEYPEIYDSLFGCLGIAPNNYALSFLEMADFYFYMDQGGCMYLEGGNAWADCYEGYMHRKFGIASAASGSGDTDIITGYPGSIVNGMTFQYAGENESMDRLMPGPGGGDHELLFRNESPIYYNAIANTGESYRSIGTSMEFSGLEDGPAEPNTKRTLMQIYAAFFGLTDPPPTCTPGPTATPTATPSGCDTLGATISMPAHTFAGGDPCGCTVDICNPGTETHTGIPLFIVLECGGYFFFWPDYSAFNYDTLELTPGETTVTVLSAFDWPYNAGSASAVWYAGMTTPDMADLFGEMSSWAFNWTD